MIAIVNAVRFVLWDRISILCPTLRQLATAQCETVFPSLNRLSDQLGNDAPGNSKPPLPIGRPTAAPPEEPPFCRWGRPNALAILCLIPASRLARSHTHSNTLPTGTGHNVVLGDRPASQQGAPRLRGSGETTRVYVCGRVVFSVWLAPSFSNPRARVPLRLNG